MACHKDEASVSLIVWPWDRLYFKPFCSSCLYILQTHLIVLFNIYDYYFLSTLGPTIWELGLVGTTLPVQTQIITYNFCNCVLLLLRKDDFCVCSYGQSFFCPNIMYCSCFQMSFFLRTYFAIEEYKVKCWVWRRIFFVMLDLMLCSSYITTLFFLCEQCTTVVAVELL